LRKLSLFQKLIVGNVVFTLFLVTLLVMTIRAKNEPITFAQWERKGNAIQLPLVTEISEASRERERGAVRSAPRRIGKPSGGGDGPRLLRERCARARNRAGPG